MRLIGTDKYFWRKRGAAGQARDRGAEVAGD